ncbi:hypothetical protein V490_01419 [Pseudogymnoascus sp. VKM F-3557]|nr:hypothetical protein V490_01419 [Pseudogymnoascus sp. VKM F-3557]
MALPKLDPACLVHPQPPPTFLDQLKRLDGAINEHAPAVQNTFASILGTLAEVAVLIAVMTGLLVSAIEPTITALQPNLRPPNPQTPTTMTTEPAIQTTSTSALAATPSNSPSQTHHRGTQTVPTIPASPATSPKPRLTRLEKLKQFDATLRLYSPVVERRPAHSTSLPATSSADNTNLLLLSSMRPNNPSPGTQNSSKPTPHTTRKAQEIRRDSRHILPSHREHTGKNGMRAVCRVTNAGPDGVVCSDANCGGCCEGVGGVEWVRNGGRDAWRKGLLMVAVVMGRHGREYRDGQFAALSSQDKEVAGVVAK